MTWHALVLLVSAAVALFSRFFRPSVFGYFEDDFFYYALVARHLVLNHISSADGIHLTNGYHPLWMLVLAACFKLAPGLDFLIAIQAVAFAAVLLYYAGLLRCLTFLGVPPNLRRLSALVLSLHALLLFRYGMEVTLALPLSIWMLAFVLAPGFRWTSRQAFAYGLLASLTVLSRLDSIFLIALLIAAQTVSAAVPWPQRLRRLAIFSLGWFPFFIYLASNVYFFHAFLPVSGSAKQLKPLWPPSSIPIQSLCVPFDRTKAVFVYPAILLILAAATIFLRSSRTRAQPQRSAVLAALFLFPVLHLSVLCLLSDWTIWPWYYYSLCYAVLAATAVLLGLHPALPPRSLAPPHLRFGLCGARPYRLSRHLRPLQAARTQDARCRRRLRSPAPRNLRHGRRQRHPRLPGRPAIHPT